MLGGDRRLALVLGVANILLAGLQFLDPVLFGRVIGLLSASDSIPRHALWIAGGHPDRRSGSASPQPRSAPTSPPSCMPSAWPTATASRS